MGRLNRAYCYEFDWRLQFWRLFIGRYNHGVWLRIGPLNIWHQPIGER